MAQVVLEIAYEIRPDQRNEYLQSIQELKAHLRNGRNKNYSVYENSVKKNSFVERYVCNSQEEFDALEDDLDEKTETLNNKIQSMILGGKSRYTTLIEL